MLYQYSFRLSDGRTITVTGASSRQEALRYVINLLNRTTARNINYETIRRAESRRQDQEPTPWHRTQTYKDIHGLEGGC
jgi:hypothetical protein